MAGRITVLCTYTIVKDAKELTSLHRKCFERLIYVESGRVINCQRGVYSSCRKELVTYCDQFSQTDCIEIFIIGREHDVCKKSKYTYRLSPVMYQCILESR